MVPKFVISEDESFPPYLSNSFKNLIVELTGDKKMISNEVVPRDPVYMAFGLGVTAGSNQSMDRQSILNNTNLYIVRDTTNKVNKDTLKTRVGSIIKDFFLPDNNNLGQNLNLSALAGSILSIDGIKRIYTKNENEDVSFNGISFLSFNPVYPENDIQLVNQDTTLPFFKFPYLYSPLTVSNRITVLDE